MLNSQSLAYMLMNDVQNDELDGTCFVISNMQIEFKGEREKNSSIIVKNV